MATEQITTHVQSQRAKQLVASVVSAFDQIRGAQQAVEDAQREALRARFRWGRQVYDALEEGKQGDNIAEEIGRRIDRTAAWVRQHARFAETVTDTFGHQYDPPIAGYLADCLDRDRSLAWRSAVSWMSGAEGSQNSDDEVTTDLERKRREVERKVEAVEEAADDLAEGYLGEGDSLDEEERRAVEGVLTRAKQAIEDNRHLAGTLEEEAPERVECEPYLRFVKDHACCLCAISDDTVVPHHPNEAYPNKGGTGTKVSDFKAVPVCFDCHEDLEETPNPLRVWSRHDTDPRHVGNELQAEWNARLVS